MPKTIRRSPYSVSTSSGDYPTRQTFNQVEFKGIQCGSNELAVDQSSFADAENVYLDRDYNLASRPPLKNDEPYKDLLKKWIFGDHSIHVEKYYTKDAGFINRISNVYELSDDEFNNIHCTFGICYKNTKTRKTKSKYFHYKATDVGWEYTPPMNCALVGDKIFIWFAGKEFICYNIASEAFEDATQYIYTPIHKQVVNGFESDLETKNFLTFAYKKRYQYSTLSDVDFEQLVGEKVEVRLLGDARTDTNAHLYDVTVESEIDKVLLYPYANVGDDLIDMVSTPRAQVFLKYSQGIASVSFNAKSFTALPQIELLGKPMLSRDGLLVVGFTSSSLVMYHLDSDFATTTWQEIPYAKNASGFTADWKPDFSNITEEPHGYFLDEENFVYTISTGDGKNDHHLYIERVVDQEKKWAFFASNQAWPFDGICSLTIKQGLPDYIAFLTDNGPTLCLFQVTKFNDIGAGYIRGILLSSAFTSIDPDRYTVDLRRTSGNPAAVLFIPHKNDDGYWLGFYVSTTTSGPVYQGALDRETVFDEGYTLAVGDKLFFGSYLANKDNTKWLKIPIAGKDVQPIYGDGSSVWYLIDGELWTSQLTEDNTLLLDLTVPGDYNLTVPDHWRELNEHYFVFNASHKLEITQHRLSNGISQLYLPEYNSQTLANNITNLWPLTDTIMGVFTAHELYYINAITMDDASIVYTKLLKSKTQIGCRDGDDMIIGPDGQTILLPTPRGITAMNASMLLDTSSQTLSYLTDPIATIYKDFYVESVSIPRFDARYGSAVPDRYDAAIKIVKHEYLILFYKYMDKTILVFDTRNSSWWRWRVQYPIRQITNENISSDAGRIVDGLIFWLNIDYMPYDDTGALKSRGGLYLPTKLSDFGTKFKFDPDADYIHPLRGPTRKDDIVDGAVTYVGHDYSVPENLREYGTPPVVEYGDPKIRWHVTSQRLHFGAINNYKCVKSFGIMAKADGPLQMKLQIKAYRDFYHPEYSELFEVNINEQRTFFRKMNMMHLTNFQYTFSNTDDEYENTPLKLNSICIKYEVKEAIR